MNRNLLFATLVLLFPLIVIWANPVCHFKHYNTEDGLPQYIVMDILQDKHGFMWFGTWDGLSRFDGYKFSNYKVRPGDAYNMKSNRIEKLYQDAFGRIWFRTYNKEIHCFDATKNIFRDVKSVNTGLDIDFKAQSIVANASGKVWLLSMQMGCVLVTDSLFNMLYFSAQNGKIPSNKVNDVFEDKERNSWVLTSNGMVVYDESLRNAKHYFSDNDSVIEQQHQSFYSAIDLDSIILFASKRGRIWKYNKKNENFKLLQTDSKSDVLSMKYLNGGRIGLTTESDGLLVYDLNTNKQIKFNKTNSVLTSHKIAKTIYFISNRYLWFSTDELGIYALDCQSMLLQRFQISITDKSILAFPPEAMVFEDVLGRVWVQPRGGGFGLFNPNTTKIDPFYNDKTQANYRFSNIVHSAFSDFQGNLWLCTRSKGLEKIVFNRNIFNYLKINSISTDDLANEVRMVLEDNDRILWVATKDGRLTLYNRERKVIGRMDKNGNVKSDAILPASIYCAFVDKKNNIWLGTRGDGIYKLRKQSDKKYHLIHYQNSQDNIYSLSDNSVYDIIQDPKGRIWIGTYGGGLNYFDDSNKTEEARFINHRNNLKNYPIENGYRVRSLAVDSNANVAVGTTSGLIMFSSNFASADMIDFKIYLRKPTLKESISNNDIHSILISRNKDMYIGTFGGGVNKVVEMDKDGFPLRFKHYTVFEGLPSDVVLSIEEDAAGMLWVSSENNLSRFNPVREEFETITEVKRFLNTGNFSEAATCRLSNQELAFGFSNGLILLNNEFNIQNRFVPQIVFTDIQLFNKRVDINTELIGGSNINILQELKLRHNQNFVSIEFAAIDYFAPENIHYAYKLEGFDKDWNYVQKQRVANYTKLPKGRYRLRVKSTNSDGVWVDNERAIWVVIEPSFWESNLALLLYFLFAAVVLYLSLRILYAFYKLKTDVAVEKKVSELKLRFFTDISHEIRTPLTLIVAPIEYLLSDAETPEKIKQHLSIVVNNTNRVLRLVNQILDLRRIQKVKLSVVHVEVLVLLNEYVIALSSMLKSKNITVDINSQNEKVWIWVDKDAFEKIVLNVLTNAIKYSYLNSKINIVVVETENEVRVEIQDYGPGISEQQQKVIFNRFSSFNKDKNNPSSGIGLSIVKELMDKHNAVVNVESRLGVGTNFSLCFKRGDAHFGSLLMSESNVESSDNNVIQLPLPVESVYENVNNLRNLEILIVEDDDELRHFISNILAPNYKVLEAKDGAVGFELAIKHLPDFIVSDIMMPNIDGIELLQKLKHEVITNHIPVILLSAKTDVETKLQGLKYGADDYLTKPFSVDYFNARIENILTQRKLLHKAITEKTIVHKLNFEYLNNICYISESDEKLIRDLYCYIEEHIENGEIIIDDLSRACSLSRTVLYRKVKAITGFSPIELVRDIRMNKAAVLLTTEDGLIKEVAYKVGIYDIRYFSRCFKEKFSATPMEYRRMNAN